MSIDNPISPIISTEELNTCVDVLRKFSSSSSYPSIEKDKFNELRCVISSLFNMKKTTYRKEKQAKRLQQKSIDRNLKNSCLLRSGRAKKLEQLHLQNVMVPDGTVEVTTTEAIVDITPSQSSHQVSRLLQFISCYICKLKYRTLHSFYDRLCPACAKLNFEKRFQTADLTNRVALVTGGRVKIGFRIVLKLLRANCFVIATSRFPMDFLKRLTQEKDFEQWKDRIHIYGVDFLYVQLLERFTQTIIDKYDRLDFLINNACQTIQRPKQFYEHLIKNERLINYPALPCDQQEILNGNLQFYQQLLPSSNRYLSHSNGTLSQTLPLTTNIPAEPNESSLIPHQVLFDVNQQVIDFRKTNSWTLKLGDLSSHEVSEVLAINTLAPFILNSKLKVLMKDKHPDPNSIKFIINVSAMEGSFSRRTKTDRHPHTNAAKAALNMMTRTSASDYQQSNIYMVSVDTGWINDEIPLERAKIRTEKQDFQTPLDEEDAAARVLDPIFNTYRQIAEGKTNIDIPYGCFLKDYTKCDW